SINDFQNPPTMLSTLNPPYFDELLERQGFSKTLDFYGWWFSDATRAADRLRKLAARLQQLMRFTIRPGNLRDLPAESARLRKIYNEAWRDNWGYVPFTEAEFAHMTKEMKPLLRPELTAIA